MTRSWSPGTICRRLQRALENHSGQIAAIITEGVMANMGVIPPADGYLQGLQKLARANGTFLSSMKRSQASASPREAARSTTSFRLTS